MTPLRLTGSSRPHAVVAYGLRHQCLERIYKGSHIVKNYKAVAKRDTTEADQ